MLHEFEFNPEELRVSMPTLNRINKNNKMSKDIEAAVKEAVEPLLTRIQELEELLKEERNKKIVVRLSSKELRDKAISTAKANMKGKHIASLEEIGAKFRDARINMNLTQKDVIALTRHEKSTMSSIELGKTDIKLSLFAQICFILGLDIYEMLNYRSEDESASVS